MSELVLWSIPAGPLLGALVAATIALVGTPRQKEQAHWACIGGIGVSLLGALYLLFNIGTPSQAAGFEWISVGGLSLHIGLSADPMTTVMLAAVTSVSLLVAIYASGYMHHDPGYPRFFAEVALFVFSMCMLVLAPNFVMLFVFWEAVGLCSYLLIGFWFQRPSAAAAAVKAFVVNRIGDCGFLLGIFLIWTTFGTLDFASVFDQQAIETVIHEHPQRLTLICLLLLAGAMGKSAQFPLHVWLPDAMEGPTPVSALIHAATMVTAGVYMVARCTPLFVHAPDAELVVSGVGGITAIVAALIALGQHDLKRVLAYSTVSQLGFMFLALGCGAADKHLAKVAVSAALFHLFTHAFFKALLFLGAGSVMHAMGDVIDMRRFGGLRKLMPRTHWTFLCGSAALAGVPLLSGFWSKDAILVALEEATHSPARKMYFQVLLVIAGITAVLTACYSFSAYFRTFWGEERIPEEAGHHAHESPDVMTWPLMILAGFAVLVGFVVGPTGLFDRLLDPHAAHAAHPLHWGVMAGSTVAALLGIGMALVFQLQPMGVWSGLKQFALRQFYLNELFAALVVWPLQALGRLLVVLDRILVDGILDVIAAVPGVVGRFIRPVQSGLVQSYALIMLAGLALFLISILAGG
jgi:NADH-quinone oxidoreductase subunit L